MLQKLKNKVPRRGYGRNKQGLRNTDRCKMKVLKKLKQLKKLQRKKRLKQMEKTGIRQIIKTKRTVLTSEKLLFRD